MEICSFAYRLKFNACRKFCSTKSPTTCSSKTLAARSKTNQLRVKYIKITTALFLVIMIGVIPFCLYREHILAIEIEKRIAAGEKIMHEGFEIILLIFYGLYSIIFVIWTSSIYLNATAQNIKRKIFELLAIFILGVLPALGIAWLFY